MTRADALALGYATLTGGLVAGLGPGWLSLCPTTAAFLALVADGVARPQSQWLLPVITHGPRDRPRVALTYDDGPDPRFTPAVAAALEAQDARGTFFCIGRHLEAHRGIGEALHEAGHELGNHSYAHSRWLNFAGPRAMRAEVERGAQLIIELTGRQPLYRPPVGLKNPPLAKVQRALDLRVVNWSLHAGDTRGASAEAIAERVLSRLRPGDIVCLHDACDRPGAERAPTVEATALILEGVRARDLAAVTVSELLS